MDWNMGFSQHIFCDVKHIHLWHTEKEHIPQRVVLFDRQEWGDHPPGMHLSLHCILTNAPWWGQWQNSDIAEGIWDNGVPPWRLQAEIQASISCLPTKTPSSANKRPYSAAVQGWPLCLGLWAAATRKISIFKCCARAAPDKWQCCSSSLIHYLFLTQHPHPFFSSLSCTLIPKGRRKSERRGWILNHLSI